MNLKNYIFCLSLPDKNEDIIDKCGAGTFRQLDILPNGQKEELLLT
jgi:hypothetical protein